MTRMWLGPGTVTYRGMWVESTHGCVKAPGPMVCSHALVQNSKEPKNFRFEPETFWIVLKVHFVMVKAQSTVTSVVCLHGYLLPCKELPQHSVA